MEPEVVSITLRGKRLLEQKIVEAKIRFEEICAERKVAHDLSGDGWHDNPHFNYMQQMEANQTWKIKELEGYLQYSKEIIVEEGARNTEVVSIGSVVEICLTNLDNQKEEYKLIEIVGFDESIPQLGMVSYTTPLGAALMGLTEDSESPVLDLPQGKVSIEIQEMFATHPGLDKAAAADLEAPLKLDIVRLGTEVTFRVEEPNGSAQPYTIKVEKTCIRELKDYHDNSKSQENAELAKFIEENRGLTFLPWLLGLKANQTVQLRSDAGETLITVESVKPF